MSFDNWLEASGGADEDVVRRGVSAGYPKPPGGGDFSFGFNPIQNAVGIVAYYTSIANFSPAAKGMSISAAIQIGPGSGEGLCSAFIFASLDGTNVGNSAYILGLSTAEEPHIILRKGALSGGLPDVAPGSQGVLRRSVDTYATGEFWHMRMDVIENETGDVVLNVYRSDLDAHTVGSPVWEAIAGLPRFVDDNIGIASGSLPLFGGGRVGFGYRSDDVARVAYIDCIKPERQL